MNCLRYFARRIIVILSGQHGNSASFLFSDVAVDECRGIIPRMLTHLNRIGLVKIIEKANRRVYVIPKYLDSEGTVVNPLWGISTVKDVEDTILGVWLVQESSMMGTGTGCLTPSGSALRSQSGTSLMMLKPSSRLPITITPMGETLTGTGSSSLPLQAGLLNR